MFSLERQLRRVLRLTQVRFLTSVSAPPLAAMATPAAATSAADSAHPTAMSTSAADDGSSSAQRALPAPGEGTVAPNATEGKKQVLEVNGERITLDEMGPVILNEDGTLARITNWQEMMEHEKQNTLRIIARRNARRREKLMAAAGASPEGVGASAAESVSPAATAQQNIEREL